MITLPNILQARDFAHLFEPEILPLFYRTDESCKPDLAIPGTTEFAAIEGYSRILGANDPSVLNRISENNLGRGFHDKGLFGPWPSRSEKTFSLSVGPLFSPRAGLLGFFSACAQQPNSQVQFSQPSSDVWNKISKSAWQSGSFTIEFDSGPVRVVMSALMLFNSCEDGYEIGELESEPEVTIGLSIPLLDPFSPEFSIRKMGRKETMVTHDQYETYKATMLNAGLSVFQGFEKAGISVEETSGGDYALDISQLKLDGSAATWEKIKVRIRRDNTRQFAFVYDPKIVVVGAHQREKQVVSQTHIAPNALPPNIQLSPLQKSLLKKTLAQFARTIDHTKIYLSNAGFELSQFNLNGPLEAVWIDIVDSTTRWGNLHLILDVFKREFSGNQDFVTYLDSLTGRSSPPTVSEIDLMQSSHMNKIRKKVLKLLESATTQQLRTLCTKAGLNLSSIDFSGSAEVIIFEIMTSVRNAGKTKAFLTVVSEDYHFHDWASLIR